MLIYTENYNHLINVLKRTILISIIYLFTMSGYGENEAQQLI